MSSHRRLPRFATYAEFWPAYLREHADPRTRRWHAAGTGLGIALVLAAAFTGNAWLAMAALVAGYGFAWSSHAAIEGNRPATFVHPLWSLLSDLRMAWLMLIRKLGNELEKAGLPST
jgi:hypothetical protein